MRYLLAILILLSAATGISAAPKYDVLPAELDGSMSLYDFQAEQPSPLPDSLAPFHICYVARHGARFLSSESKVKSCEKALKKARERGSLTKRGRLFAALLDSVRARTADRWGQLSPVGLAEEYQLGRGMARMFPDVFTPRDARVTSISSYVPRVVQTMDCFTVSIAESYEGINTSASSGRQYDPITRFFVTDTVYDRWRTSGRWKRVYDDFVARHISVEPAIRLLGPHSGLTDKELRAFTYDMYKVLQSMRAASLPAPDTRWMTPEEYRACWEATNLEKYFRYSVSPLSDIPARGAAYLLYQWIDASMRLEAGELAPGLSGIFGHAETLLPFLALLGVDEAVALPDDYERLADVWSDARLTPLGANIALILSRGPSGELYASMRLNGRNISPVGQTGRLTVPLGEVRAGWLSRLARLTGGSQGN